MKRLNYLMSVAQFALWVVLILFATIECIAQLIMLGSNEVLTNGGKVLFCLLMVGLLTLLCCGGKTVYKEMCEEKKKLDEINNQ